MAKHRVAALQLENWSHPSLMARDPRTGDWHYDRLPQRIGHPLPKGTVIVKEYGCLDFDDDDAWNAVLVQFTRDFPPEIGVRDSPGWLAPDGRFFPCRSWEHDSMAHYLYRFVYGEMPETSATVAFERRGWVRVYEDVFSQKQDLTQPQLNTLWDLSQVTTSEQLKRLIGLEFDK